MSEEAYDMMYEYYQEWGRMARRAYIEGLNARIPAQYKMTDKIFFCGMGGSGIAGLYAAHVLEELEADRLTGARTGLRLPRWVGRRTLVFAISFSGNTWETMDCALTAHQRGAKVMLISRGGMMEDIARERSLFFLRVPTAPAPRAGLPALLYSVLGILVNLNMLDPNEAGVDDSIELMIQERAAALEYGETYAATLYKAKSRPLIVASGESLQPVVLRAKNEFAENSKIPVYMGVFPESGHNDIEAWARLEGKTMIVIRTGNPVEDSMLDAAISVVRPRPVLEIRSRSMKPLVKLMWPSWLIGLASLNLANMLGVGVAEIPNIDRYKKAFRRSRRAS